MYSNDAITTVEMTLKIDTFGAELQPSSKH